MIDRIKKLVSEVEAFSPSTVEEIEDFRLKYLSKKGFISVLFDDFRNVPAEQKKEIGVEINVLKQKASEKLELLKSSLVVSDNGILDIDLTRPSDPLNLGSRHPISIVRNQIIEMINNDGIHNK